VAGEMLKRGAEFGFSKRLLPTLEVEHLRADEADALLPYARYMLGANLRGVGIRAKKLLGWKPTEPSFEEDMERAIHFGAELLGIAVEDN
jgi:hypothetical protein